MEIVWLLALRSTWLNYVWLLWLLLVVAGRLFCFALIVLLLDRLCLWVLLGFARLLDRLASCWACSFLTATAGAFVAAWFSLFVPGSGALLLCLAVAGLFCWASVCFCTPPAILLPGCLLGSAYAAACHWLDVVVPVVCWAASCSVCLS